MQKKFETKVIGKVEKRFLLSLGFQPLGDFHQEDIYLSGCRVRRQNGELTLGRRVDLGIKANCPNIRASGITPEEPITEARLAELIKEKGIKIRVHKDRSLFQLGSIIVSLEEVEHLGSFMEISAPAEEEVLEVMARLDVGTDEISAESYRVMIERKEFPRWLQLILGFHEKVGQLAQGVTSGIITTLGLMMGVNSSNPTRRSIMVAILAMAIGNSCSDAYSVYNARQAERGSNRRVAWRFALMTLAGEFVFTLSFVLAVAILPLSTGIIANLAWGTIALALFSAEQAVVGQKNVILSVGFNLGLAAAIVVLTSQIENIIDCFKG